MSKFRYDNDARGDMCIHGSAKPSLCGECIKTDLVCQPAHYTAGGIETIDYLQAKLSPEEFAGFCRGNMLKYVSRAGLKDDAAQDMRKALWYGERWLSARDAGT